MGERGADYDAPRVFVVRGRAGYACGVYATFDAASEAVGRFLSAFSAHEVIEPLYRVNPDSLHMEWWRLYFRVRSGGPMDEIEIVEHEIRGATPVGTTVIPSDVPTPSDGGEDCPEHPGFECHPVFPGPTPSDREEQR